VIRTTEDTEKLVFLRVSASPWLVFQVFGITEGEASCRHLPGCSKRFREVGIAVGDLVGQRGELLIDAGQSALIFLRVASLFHVAAEQPYFFNQLRQQDGKLVFHLS
jgi:hypothetical protein